MLFPEGIEKDSSCCMTGRTAESEEIRILWPYMSADERGK